MENLSEQKFERTLLVGAFLNNEEEFLYSMKELKNLAISCELDVIGEITQKLRSVTAATYLGKGKVDEIKSFVENNEIEIIVLNEELSTSQTRNIQEIIGCRVIDRTLLILDIFARRARTKEAILQVQIAQLQYILPRISLMSGNFNERLGTRGPGETKYELDRRKIEKQISLLGNELNEMVENRKTQRKRRVKNDLPIVALVGYTNAGKSTLMNTLLDFSKIKNEDKTVFAIDLLFATLETTTRQIVLEDNKKFLLTDTVGFVSRLPHQLVKAFRSTLEEITEADLILHVVDISNKNYQRELNVTEKVLTEIGVKDIPIIHVYNKMDRFDSLNVGEGIFISAEKKLNIDDLINEIGKFLFKDYRTVKMLIPYTSGFIFNYLKENANVIREKYIDEGIDILVELNEHLYNKYKHLIK